MVARPYFPQPMCYKHMCLFSLTYPISYWRTETFLKVDNFKVKWFDYWPCHRPIVKLEFPALFTLLLGLNLEPCLETQQVRRVVSVTLLYLFWCLKGEAKMRTVSGALSREVWIVLPMRRNMLNTEGHSILNWQLFLLVAFAQQILNKESFNDQRFFHLSIFSGLNRLYQLRCIYQLGLP